MASEDCHVACYATVGSSADAFAGLDAELTNLKRVLEPGIAPEWRFHLNDVANGNTNTPPFSGWSV
ncbi:MAG: hypothetical protein RIF41_00890, partial [Polyangiaceae bacterium]